MKMTQQTFYDLYNYPDGNKGRKQYWKKCLSKFINLSSLKGKKVLDVGCGTGTFSSIMQESAADTYAIDLSRKSIKYVNQTYPKINASTGDALDLPYADNEFDVVLSMGVLHHTENTKKGFRECIRVCKPKGQIIILLYTKWHYYPLIYKGFQLIRNGRKPESMPEWFIEKVRRFTEWYHKEECSKERAINLIADQFFTPIAKFYSEFEIRKWCRELNTKLIITSTTYFMQHKIYSITKC